MEATCTMCKCSAFKILMNGELTAFPLSNEVIYFVNKCEAMFSIEQLRISKCT